MFHLLPLHRLSLRILVFMIARHNAKTLSLKNFFYLLKGNSMFFFLLWNLSLMYEFSLLHQVPLVTIGLHRCALVTNYSGEAEEERLSATQHNTTGRGSVQHITLVTKTQTQNLDQWTLKPKHNIYIGFGGALLRRTLTNSEILLHTVKEH